MVINEGKPVVWLFLYIRYLLGRKQPSDHTTRTVSWTWIQKTITPLTLHPALHGLLSLTASYYSPKSHKLLSNCKETEKQSCINTEWRSDVVQTNIVLMIWQMAYGNTFKFIFSMQCPLVCGARGLTCRQPRSWTSWYLWALLGLCTGWQIQPEERVHEGFNCLSFFHCPIRNAQEILVGLTTS